MDKKSGVYCIKNTTTNKLYVGSSADINRRKAKHFSLLRNNKHYNSILQNSFNKHGESAFSFSILEKCDPRELIAREQFYIDKYNLSNNNFGYNIASIAGRTTGVAAHNKGIKWTKEQRSVLSAAAKNRKSKCHTTPHTQQTKIKISLSLSGKNMGLSHHSSKIVLNLDTGIFYDSIKDASDIFGIKYRTLHARLTGENNFKSSLKLV